MESGRGPTSRVYAWLRARPGADDAIGAAVLTLVVLWEANLFGWQRAFGLLMTVALPWRRIRPVASATGVAVGALVQVAVNPFPSLADIAILVALYSVVAYGPRWAVWAFVAVAVLGAVLAGIRWNGSPALGEVMVVAFGCMAVAGVAGTAGEVRRLGRLHEQDQAERTRRDEAQRLQRAELAAADERARIAREMHDVVAHSLAVMITQADGASYALSSDPDTARAAMRTVADTGRRAMAEMRGLLGVLRDGASGAAPLPSLQALADLVESVRASGLRLTLDVRGTPPADLAATWQLVVYRIVQESTTNVLRHAGRVHCRVQLDWTPGQLVLTVTDDGRAGAPAAAVPTRPGHGIAGMRERAESQGGRLMAGPLPAGGWVVMVELPYPVDDPAPTGIPSPSGPQGRDEITAVPHVG